MPINFKSLFSKCEKRAVSHRPVNFSESLLRFAAYAEGNNLLFPYWKNFNEIKKFDFIEDCFMNASKVNERNYIIERRIKLWSYLIDNTNFSCISYDREVLQFYVPVFVVYLIGMLGGVKLRRPNIPWGYEEFLLEISKCESAKEYFSLLCQKLERLCCICDEIFLRELDVGINKQNLPIIEKSILQRIDSLIRESSVKP